MAKLRGGSTVGGKQVVTLDIMNEFIYQIQTAELMQKMKKAETDERITDFATADTFIKNKDKNGLWQVNNATNNDGKYGYGQLLNFSNENARFQLYAPHQESELSALYFRTGWDNTIKSWERVASKSMLDTGLNSKFDKTGGNITGAINVSDTIRTNKEFSIVDTNGTRAVTQKFNDRTYRFVSGAIDSYQFDQPLYASRGLFVNDYSAGAGYSTRSTPCEVWHEGNLNPSIYMRKDSIELARGTNLNTVKDPGIYRCDTPTSVPTAINAWAYIEVIKHNDSYALQKIYSYNGLHSFFRVLENGTWRSWKSMNGVLSKTIEIATNSWALVDGTYEATITHNLDSENITSVIVTDSNKISMFTGFQVISSTVIKIFCSTNPAGKVVVNATN